MTLTPHHWYKDYYLLMFDEIDSTNEEAKRLMRAGVAGDFVIWSKKQTAGHGRYGKEWLSPEGNLYCSLLLNAPYDLETISQLVFVAAIAVGEVIKKALPAKKNITYKWPNDILIEGKKVAGILLETEVSADKSHAYRVIIGIGVNVTSAPDLPDYTAAALAEEGSTLSVDQVLDKLMEQFSYWLELWRQEGFAKIRKAWLKNASHKGKVVTACTGNERISGVFEGLSDIGELVLTLAGGQVYRVSAGEVFFQEK